jgi:hypothetical protein
MDELPPAPPRLVRKAAYGRTELFLPSASTVLREVKCMGGMTRYDVASVYHLLPPAHETATCCWHCCEPLEPGATTLPLPRLYDAEERVYHVYGCACSPGCAKAYILEHATFDRGQHLNVLVRMLREVYGVTEAVRAAPPRAGLRRFGGPFDPRTQSRAECAIVEPPFVSYCMLVEERARATTSAPQELPRPVAVVEEADTLEEPPPPGLYEAYLRDAAHEAPEPSSGTKRCRQPRDPQAESDAPPPPPPRGPLARFVKPK